MALTTGLPAAIRAGGSHSCPWPPLGLGFLHQGFKDCEVRARGHGLQRGDSTELGTDAQKQLGPPWLPRKPLLGSMHSTLQAPSPLPQPAVLRALGATSSWAQGLCTQLSFLGEKTAPNKTTPSALAGSVLGGELTPDL